MRALADLVLRQGEDHPKTVYAARTTPCYSKGTTINNLGAGPEEIETKNLKDLLQEK